MFALSTDSPRTERRDKGVKTPATGAVTSPAACFDSRKIPWFICTEGIERRGREGVRPGRRTARRDPDLLHGERLTRWPAPGGGRKRCLGRTFQYGVPRVPADHSKIRKERTEGAFKRQRKICAVRPNPCRIGSRAGPDPATTGQASQ